MNSAWGWQIPRDDGVWAHGAAWARPFIAACPYLSFGVLLLQLAFANSVFSTDVPGVVVDLPAGAVSESALPSEVALVSPAENHSSPPFVFFDDGRYDMSSSDDIAAFKLRLAAKTAKNSDTLLLLADRRIPSGELMHIVEVVRASGVKRVQIGEKKY